MNIPEKEWQPLGKKYNWIERNVGDLVYELTIKDNGRKIDRFMWNTKKKFKEILELLRLKYGMN